MYDPAAGGIFRYSTRGNNFNGGSTNTTAWHHVAFVYQTNDGTNYLYVNGVRAPNISNFAETAACEYVNQNSANRLNSGLANTGLKMYILSSNGAGNNMDSTVDSPIYNLRITKKAVYTANFTPPTQLSTTQTAGTNIAAIGANECVFCLESYTQGGVTTIRDAVQGTSLTGVLQLVTTNGAR